MEIPKITDFISINIFQLLSNFPQVSCCFNFRWEYSFFVSIHCCLLLWEHYRFWGFVLVLFVFFSPNPSQKVLQKSTVVFTEILNSAQTNSLHTCKEKVKVLVLLFLFFLHLPSFFLAVSFPSSISKKISAVNSFWWWQRDLQNMPPQWTANSATRIFEH